MRDPVFSFAEKLEFWRHCRANNLQSCPGAAGQSLFLRSVIPFTPSERCLVGPWIRVQVTNEMRGEGESSYTSCFIGGQNRK